MGCNCKTNKGKIKTNETSTSNGTPTKLNIGQQVSKILKLLLLGIALTIALPLIWLLLIIIVTKSFYGEPLDLGKTFKKMLNKKDKVELEEEINPEDYELVGVDTVK